MIIGTGIDIVDIKRFSDTFEHHNLRFKKKFFTPKEVSVGENKINFFAGRFATKEAISKALGCGFGKYLKWTDLEILPDHLGKPILTQNKILENIVKSNFICHISISHEKNYVVANAIIEKSKK